MLTPFCAKISRLTLVLATLMILSACQRSLTVERPQPLEQEPFIQAYFNHNQAQGADYTEPYRKITRPGDNLEQIIIDTIDSAQSTIDVAVQEFRLPNIAQALVERHQAGINVRVILENNYSRPFSDLSAIEINQLNERSRNYYNEFVALVDINKDGQLSQQEIKQRDALIILRNAGIPIIDDTADGSQGSSLMHHKFVIVDGNLLIVTSANFTTSDVHGDFGNPENRGNANNLLKLNSPQLAKLFTEEFSLMWGDGPGGQFDSKFGLEKPVRAAQTITLGKTTVTVHFSPISSRLPWGLSSNGLIGYTLAQATQSINLALFVFSEQELANVLETRHQHQVDIKALIDPEFAFRDYSEGLDMLGVSITNKCRSESNNHPWQFPIKTVGIPQLPQGDKLHHKFGVVDETTIITGSHNWSAAANYQNDETVLVINSPLLAAHFSREFEQLYHASVLGVPAYAKEKIQKESQKCLESNTVSSNVGNEIVNINKATQEELESLPGIGTKLAQRIIESRQQKSFNSLEDLDRVSGIGSNQLNKLAGKVTF